MTVAGRPRRREGPRTPAERGSPCANVTPDGGKRRGSGALPEPAADAAAVAPQPVGDAAGAPQPVTLAVGRRQVRVELHQEGHRAATGWAIGVHSRLHPGGRPADAVEVGVGDTRPALPGPARVSAAEPHLGLPQRPDGEPRRDAAVLVAAARPAVVVVVV